MIHAVGGFGVESRIEELFGCGDTDVGEPGFVPAVVDLEEAVATVVGDADGIGVEPAFATGDLDGAFLEVIGPFLADDLLNLDGGVFDPLDDLLRSFGLSGGFSDAHVIANQDFC